MKSHTRLLVLALGLLVLAASTPAFAQQQQGDSELGLNGAITIPDSDPGGGTTGLVAVNYGYYFRQNDLVGLDTLVIFNGNFQSLALLGRYRHLFSTNNPMVYPFVGVQAGGIVAHDGGTNGNVAADGEAGVKFFVSQRTAIEVAYNFQYENTGGGFSHETFNVITFGFTHIFGGHHK